MKIGGNHTSFIDEKARSIIYYGFLPDPVLIFTEVHMAIAVDLRAIHPDTACEPDTVVAFILDKHNRFPVRIKQFLIAQGLIC
jgi:hypothetical protein